MKTLGIVLLTLVVAVPAAYCAFCCLFASLWKGK